MEARAYHSRLEPMERIEIENALLENKLKVVVSTSALGMGFDKPDLGFLIHLGIPKTKAPFLYLDAITTSFPASISFTILGINNGL